MASTTILLREDVEALGGRGEVVKVKSGYARNYLLPQGLATLATKGNVKQIEQEREALLKKAAVEKATAEAQKDQMGVIELAFERKAGEGGTLFGSVTSMDIAEALQQKGYEIDRRRIALRDAIKETGEYVVKVKLHREVVLEVPVTVTAEGGEEAAPTEAKPAKRGRKAKAETADVPEAETPTVTEGAEPTPEEPAAE
ncbi:MAG TPA: 50S ribosomal protein L9 [Pyrinomonadaceae bacterium]|nr:50S ribosomal protein L9 [Pyrinomonadaceae bacterium]